MDDDTIKPDVRDFNLIRSVIFADFFLFSFDFDSFDSKIY